VGRGEVTDRFFSFPFFFFKRRCGGGGGGGGGQVYWIYRLASEKPVEQRRKIQWSPVKELAMANNLAKELKPYQLNKMKVRQWMTCTWLQQAEAWKSLRISLRVKREDWWWPCIISLGRCKMCIVLYFVAFVQQHVWIICNMFGASAASLIPGACWTEQEIYWPWCINCQDALHQL